MKIVLVGFVLGLLFVGSVVWAANKTATLVPPADYTAGGWSVTVEAMAVAGATATRWCATTTFLAVDTGTGATDRVAHTVCTNSPPSDITTFVNNRLSAARTANGY